MSNLDYTIYTNLDPQMLTEVGLEIYKRWVAFAMGEESINGKSLDHPTGKYAASIHFRQVSKSRVAIFSESPKTVPEADILETGHGAVDLKKKLQAGRVYPMHRGQKGAYGSAGYGPPVPLPGRKSLWAEARSMGRSGAARVPTKITPENANSWIIPVMPAYSPAKHLADLYRAQYGIK